jgi:parallel beta-helix repeat protein
VAFFTELFVFPSPAPAGKVIDSRYITSDKVWEGDITIRGIVKVARGATLIIRPGTIISFTRLDRDEDGVGDNALFLQGRLLARGTKENPIVFTSAELKKKRGDWNGLNIIVSDRVQNILEFCRIEYALQGLHSHFSNLIISNCNFSNNFRGIYFQEAKATIEETKMVGNLSGMRCRDAELVLRGNEFSDNYWGADILRSRLLITGNHFVNNLFYGLRLRQGRGEIIANNFQQNQLGLRLQEGVVRIEKNRVQNNYETGISFISSEVIAQSNNIVGNASVGVLARQSKLYFTANTVINNGKGFSLLSSPLADLAFNLINSNMGNGIAASESRLILRNNSISRNENGVRIKQAPSVNLIGNRIQSNRKNGFSAEGSQVVFQQNLLWGNENGVNAKKSRIILQQTTIGNNRIAGLDVQQEGTVSVYDSVITGNREVGITAKNEAIEIADCRISENGQGIRIEDNDSVTIIRSTLSNNRKAGIEAERARGMITNSFIHNNDSGIKYRLSDLAITANKIRKNSQQGIFATGSISVLTGNRIERNKTGGAFVGSESVVAEANLIRGNTKEGLSFIDVLDASITGNRLTKNGTGIQTDNSRVKFSGNSLGENQDKAFRLIGSIDVDAQDNWWGTAEEKQIEDMIYDINDGVNAGEVFFSPYLHKPPYITGLEKK